MTPLDGLPILTAAEMRAAEARAIAAGATVTSLMEAAGAAIARGVRRFAGVDPILILCGPGNNGGDGYVAARLLAASGNDVRVAAAAKPRSEAAARAAWTGPVEPLPDAAPAPILVDCLFGTGLSRPLDDALAGDLARLASAARFRIAVDLPSGVATDDGAILSATPVFDLTLALGAAKPSHVLQPAASYMGAVRVLDIGVSTTSEARVIARPVIVPPSPEAHKYTRGMVAIVAGAMPGAAALAATAAAHGGAGYVLLLGSATDRLPHAIVRRRYDVQAIEDTRIGALLVGPGLGRNDRARERLDHALAGDRPLVLDGDALHLVTIDRLATRDAPTVLTPHAGEFAALFGKGEGSKIERTRAATAATGATVIFKGADTVIATPDGRVIVAPSATSWLSTAGTGDVLAGLVAAQLAVGRSVADAVWLHGEAARRAGPAFLADDLMRHLPAAIASCR